MTKVIVPPERETLEHVNGVWQRVEHPSPKPITHGSSGEILTNPNGYARMLNAFGDHASHANTPRPLENGIAVKIAMPTEDDREKWRKIAGTIFVVLMVIIAGSYVGGLWSFGFDFLGISF
jgi:hypothetical protein